MNVIVLPLEKVVCNNCGKLVGIRTESEWELKRHNMVRNTPCPESTNDFVSPVIWEQGK